MGSYSDQAADGDMLCKDEARCCSCTGTPAAGAQGCHAATGALFLHASIISPISIDCNLSHPDFLLAPAPSQSTLPFSTRLLHLRPGADGTQLLRPHMGGQYPSV